MRHARFLVAFLVALSGLIAASTVARADADHTLRCSGGPIAPGHYEAIRVAGFCSISGGTVRVDDNLSILPGAGLDASNPSGTLRVGGNLLVGRGAILALGCSPVEDHCIAPANRIGESLHADGALTLIVKATHIEDGLTSRGGGGGNNCDPITPFGPAFTAIEDDSIRGDVTVANVQSCWIGFIRNHISGNATFTNNVFNNLDAMEIVTNRIGESLICRGNSPAPHVGDSGGSPNQVEDRMVGQCMSIV